MINKIYSYKYINWKKKQKKTKETKQKKSLEAAVEDKLRIIISQLRRNLNPDIGTIRRNSTNQVSMRRSNKANNVQTRIRRRNT